MKRKPEPTPRDMDLFARTVGGEVFKAVVDHLDAMYPWVGNAMGSSCRRSARNVAINQARVSINPPKESK